MKVPLGIFLGNTELAEGIRLVAPLEIKPHVRYPAGTVLFTKEAPTDTQQPLEKITQVLDKLKERCVKAKNSKVFMDAMEPMEKEITPYFNADHELVEQNVVFINVAYTDDMAWPDGKIWKILSTLYPHYYPEPDGKAKYSEIVKMLETKQVQFLNDISLPYNDSFLVEYRTILDRAKYIGLREKMDKLGKSMKKTDVFDVTSDGSFICSKDLYSYTKKLLVQAKSKITDEIWDLPEIQEMIHGDPLLQYRLPDSRQGIYIAHNDVLVSGRIKDFIKANYMKFLGETTISSETERSIKSLKPKFLFLGPTGQGSEIDMSLVENCVKNGGGASFGSSDMTVFAFLNEKTASVENNLRAAGVTFIFTKDDVLNNFKSFSQRILGTMDLYKQGI